MNKLVNRSVIPVNFCPFAV